MRTLKKMSFNALIENMSMEEQKSTLAGSGSVMNGSYYGSGGSIGGYSTGNMGYYASDRGMSSNFTPAGTLLYTPNGNYSAPSISSNQNSYGYGSTSYNTNNYGSGSKPLSNSVGWTSTGNSIKTTNENDISRVLNFMYSNTVSKTAVTWNMVAGFLNNELTASGRATNDALYGPVQLNNVTVLNKYKGPSTIPQGMVYDNGVLTLGVAMGSHGVLVRNSGSSSEILQVKTPAVLVPFTKEELINGFNKVGFSGMTRPFIEDWDPVKGQYNNATRFKADMKLNVDGASVIALYEKLSLTLYDKDSNTGQNATIGFGHLLHPGAIKSGDIKSITFDQAVSFFSTDIIETERVLNQKIENMDLTGKFNRNQYFALVDMAYNGGNSSDSILVAVLNGMKSGGVDAANKIITDSYINQNNGGLKDRRYFEAQAFVNGRSITPEQADQELRQLGLKK
ncbi:hypothetical protein [Flavobacterium sp. CLA17]|uniref:glycoside hydrolase family protein n=1 Tax=Flavobacterium sp. CLA17 TaxID=2724135 RepID=UPI0014918EB9|nr:hypothetical protein [Flavobacterium sp. CLA17]QSB26061.1 hypothetical protein HAV12_016980 [Flavobacterium sp. CLA17]